MTPEIETEINSLQLSLRLVVAWTVLLVLLWFIARFPIGYTVLYYLAVLTLVTLLAVNSQSIVDALQPIANPTSA